MPRDEIDALLDELELDEKPPQPEAVKIEITPPADAAPPDAVPGASDDPGDPEPAGADGDAPEAEADVGNDEDRNHEPRRSQLPAFGLPNGWRVAADGTLVELDAPIPGTRQREDTRIGPVLWIAGLIRHENGDEDLRVAWLDGTSRRTATLSGRAMSDPYKLVDLATKGFPIVESSLRPYSRWLHAFYQTNKAWLPVVEQTGRLGWHGRRFVWPDEIMSPPDAPSTRRLVFHPRDENAARIAAAIRTRRGSLDGWAAAIRPVYETYPHVAVGVAMSFGSLLLGPLGLTESVVLDLHDEQGSGKTSLMRLCASAFGETDGEDRLVTSWGSTMFGLEMRAGTLGSLPLFLDETRERRRNVELAPYVYMLANGHGADRGATPGAPERLSWKLATVSTGEASLTEYVAEAGGALGRILPLPGMPFGEKSPKQKRMVAAVVQAVSRNCGWAARDFVRRLIAGEFGSFEALRADYDRRLDALLERGYESRLAGSVALVELTGDLLHRAFSLRMPDLTALWFRVRNTSGKPGDERAALDALASIVAEQRHRIYGLVDDDDDTTRPWGDELGVYREGKLALHPNKVRQLLAALKFDFPAAIRAWDRRGLLDRDGRNIGPKVQCGPMRTRMLRFTAEATREVFGIGDTEAEPEAGDAA